MTTSTVASVDLRSLLHRFITEVVNGRDLDRALSELVAEDFVEHHPLPGQGPGRAGLADVLRGLFDAFPDLHWTVRETVVEGDRIVAHSCWTGSHQGPFMGVPATGNPVSVEAWTLDRYRDGRMTESRIIMDALGLLVQIGAVPPPSAA